MNYGAMNHRFEIQENTAATDDYGQPVDGWSTLANGKVWGKIHNKDSKEFYRASQVHAQMTDLVELHWHPELTQEHRLLHVRGNITRTLNILGINNVDYADRALLVTCKEEP